MSLPSCLYITPGIYTLLVALIAGVVPTLKVYERKWWIKVIYAIVLSCLCGLEFAAIRHDRREQDDKHRQDLGEQRQQFTDTIRNLLEVKTSVDDLKQVTINLNTARTGSTFKESVKITTLQLSKDILTFMAERDNLQPVFAFTTSGLPPLQAKNDAIESLNLRTMSWKTDTLSEYSKLFSPRVVSQLGKLKTQHVNVDDATELCTRATNPTMIRMCGKEIGDLALRLPN